MKKSHEIFIKQFRLIQTIRFLVTYIFNDFPKNFSSQNGFENSLKLHNGLDFLHSLSKMKFKVFETVHNLSPFPSLPAMKYLRRNFFLPSQMMQHKFFMYLQQSKNFISSCFIEINIQAWVRRERRLRFIFRSFYELLSTYQRKRGRSVGVKRWKDLSRQLENRRQVCQEIDWMWIGKITVQS